MIEQIHIISCMHLHLFIRSHHFFPFSSIILIIHESDPQTIICMHALSHGCGQVQGLPTDPTKLKNSPLTINAYIVNAVMKQTDICECHQFSPRVPFNASLRSF